MKYSFHHMPRKHEMCNQNFIIVNNYFKTYHKKNYDCNKWQIIITYLALPIHHRLPKNKNIFRGSDKR